jgi:hypothetical protein
MINSRMDEGVFSQVSLQEGPEMPAFGARFSTPIPFLPLTHDGIVTNLLSLVVNLEASDNRYRVHCTDVFMMMRLKQ